MMRGTIISVLAVLVCGCSSNDFLDFRIKAMPGEGVDAKTARKIVLSRALQGQNQYGDVVLAVYRRTQEAKEQCFVDEFYSKALGEFCGAEYVISTPYRQGEGYSAFNVIEECLEGQCNYRFSSVNLGIED